MGRSRKRNTLVEEDLHQCPAPIYPDLNATPSTFYKLFDGAMLIDVGQLMSIVHEKETAFEKFTTALFLECTQGISFQKAVIDPSSVISYLSCVDLETEIERNCHITWIKCCIDYCSHFDNMKFVSNTENQLAQLKKKVSTNSIIPGLSFSISRIIQLNESIHFQNDILAEPVDLARIAVRFSHNRSDGTKFIRSFTVHMLQNVFPVELHQVLSATKSAKYKPIGDEIHTKIEELLKIALGKVPSLEVDTHISTNVRDSSVRFFENARKRKLQPTVDEADRNEARFQSSETGLTLSDVINGYQEPISLENSKLEQKKVDDSYESYPKRSPQTQDADSSIFEPKPEDSYEPSPKRQTQDDDSSIFESKPEDSEEDTKYGLVGPSYL